MTSKLSQHLFAVLLLAAGLSGCTRKAPPGVFVDPAFGPLIAPDTKLIAGVRLDKLRETPLFKKLSARFDIDRRLDLFSQRTGLPPGKDVWQVLLASNGSRTLVMARGRFTTGEMEPKLGSLGATRTRYKDYTLIGNPQTSIVFLNPGVAVAGSQTDLKDLLDHRSEYSQIPAPLAERLGALPSLDQIWVVSNGFPPWLDLNGTDSTGMKSMLSNFVGYIHAVALGVHADSGAELGGIIECVSDEGAQRVRDALKGGVGLARLNTRDGQMDLLKVYDSVQVTQSAAAVHVAAQVPSDLVDPLLQMLPKSFLTPQ